MSIKVTMELLSHLEANQPLLDLDAHTLYQRLLAAQESLAAEKQRQKDEKLAEADAKKMAATWAKAEAAEATKAQAKLKKSEKLVAEVEKAKKWAEKELSRQCSADTRHANTWNRLLNKFNKHSKSRQTASKKAARETLKAEVEAEKARKKAERETKKAEIEAEKALKKAAKEAKKAEADANKRTNKKSGYGVFRSQNTGKGWKPVDFAENWKLVSEEERIVWEEMAKDLQ